MIAASAARWRARFGALLGGVLMCGVLAGTALAEVPAPPPGGAAASEPTTPATGEGSTEPAAPSISLLTFGPGEIYWERFGHNAIVVRDPAGGRAVSYNYGIFDFEDEDFLANFMRGHMRYRIDAAYADEDIAAYAAQGRWVVEQQLALQPDQARALAAYLAWNLEPDNAFYRYEYFTSNCSTRVRDALDEALGGALRAQLTAPSRGYTFRLLTDALMSPQPLLMGVLDAGLGPYADRRLSFWDDAFIPMQLMSHLREVRVPGADGQPIALVSSERVLAPARLPDPPALPPDLRWGFLAAGLVLGGALLALHARRRAAWARGAFSALALVLALACGLAGLVLLGLWGLTEHRSAWANENLLVLNPLCLLLVPAWWGARRTGWRPSRFARALGVVLVLMAGFALFAKVLPWFVQANLPWLLLLAPVHAAGAWCLARAQRISS
ncbi:Lnb N-terminal periplasmic domain-containing protein [Dokdonella sp. MW10]|uniref:Lnb N-terminal periplasmic domain-containing protein n=1 Tax=Dokdonella sp. MW10 TaxID=2992926 RepID=UPI003F7D4812